MSPCQLSSQTSEKGKIGVQNLKPSRNTDRSEHTQNIQSHPMSKLSIGKLGARPLIRRIPRARRIITNQEIQE